MAQIEQLVAAIADPALRDLLAREIKSLKDQKRFGLVFERHLPETVFVETTSGLRVGDVVRLRRSPEGPDFRVVDVAAVVRIQEAGTDTAVDVASQDIRAVKAFGETVYPVLREVNSVRRSDTRPSHTVINGENFHAVQLLAQSLERQVDCIYIDPPYNSGSSTWMYNNKFVDDNDSWRHSKWLSFMDKRLKLARRLLKPDGVLIVTIDENEVHHLGLLLEEVFPEYLRYMVTIVINPKGTNKANFGRTDEQAFFVVPNTGYDVIAHPAPPEDEPGYEGDDEQDEADEDDEPAEEAIDAAALDVNDDLAAVDEVPNYSVLYLRRRGAESSSRKDRWKQFYAIYVDENERKVVGIGPEIKLADPFEITRHDGILSVYPIDKEGNHRVWRYGRATMQAYIDNGDIRVGKYNAAQDTYTLNHWKPLDGPKVQRPKTVWWRKNHDAGTHGSTLISKLLGRRNPFPFPKSLYAVRDSLELVVKDRPDAVIVDFFAGSGTTLHATMLLNAKDVGRRRAILVTNNDVSLADRAELAKEDKYLGDLEYEARGIFESATMPRCISAITGVRPDGSPMPKGKPYRYADGRAFRDGFEENATFFKLEYVNPDRVELGMALAEMYPLFWLAAGSRGPVPTLPADVGDFSVHTDSGFAVLRDERGLRELELALAETPGVTHVFVVTDSEDTFAIANDLLRTGDDGKGRRVVMLYRDYLASYRRMARQFR
jgi:adenine-specific DNA-methyltransferase